MFFELNAEPRSILVEDKSAAVETVHRERASSDPGSVGSPLAGVVVEIRAQEGHDVKAGGEHPPLTKASRQSTDTSAFRPLVRHVCHEDGDGCQRPCR